MAWKELYLHSIDRATREKIEILRMQYIALGDMIETLPDSNKHEARCKALAKTALEESLMRATQCYAMNGELQEPGA